MSNYSSSILGFVSMVVLLSLQNLDVRLDIGRLRPEKNLFLVVFAKI